MRNWLLSLLGLALVLAFQNCTPSSKPASAKETNLLSAQGNGDGYDGKLYVHVNDGGLCPDGREYDSIVAVREDQMTLVRSNCRDLPQAEQVALPVAYESSQQNAVIFQNVRHVLLHITYQDLFGASADSVYALGFGYKTDLVRPLPIVAKIGSDDRLAWTRSLRDSSTGMPTEVNTGLAAGQGGALVAGVHRVLDLFPRSNDHYAFVGEISAAGTVLWSRNFAPADSKTKKLYINGIARSAGGRVYLSASVGHYLTGSTGLAPDRWDSGLIEISAVTGAPLSENWFEDIRLAGKPVFTSDGDMIVHSRTQVLRFTPEGRLRWSKEIPGTVAAVLPAPNNELFIAGTLREAANDRGFAARLQADGNPAWAVRLDTPGEISSRINAASAGHKGEILVFGDGVRDTGRVGFVAAIADPLASEVWNVEHQEGFADRFTKGVVTSLGRIWSAFYFAPNPATAGTSPGAGEMLRPLGVDSNPSDCAACRVRSDLSLSPLGFIVSTPALPSVTAFSIGQGVPGELSAVPLAFPLSLSTK